MIPSLSFAPTASDPPRFIGGGVPRTGFSRAIGMLLALLLHGLMLWLILSHPPMVIKPPAGGSDAAITYIAPLAQAPSRTQPITPPKPTPKPEKPKKTKPAPKAPSAARPPRPKTETPPAPQLAATEPLTPAPNVAPQPDAVREPPAEDFTARLEANRRRRAEAQAQDPALAQAPQETESQRANRIARDNIAFSQRGQAAERDQTGGVFQLRDVRTHSAEFMFRGWNTNFQRNWSQLVAVDQGTEPDIERAVVKRMIALIRTHKTGEFIWESHRLGKQITLNADPAFQRELEAFLLKEFFPEYVRTNGRG